MKQLYAGLGPVLLLGLASFALQDNKDKAPARKSELAKTVAVVDINKVSEAYPHYELMKSLMEQREGEWQVLLKAKKKQLDIAKLDTNGVVSGSELARGPAFEVDRLSNELEFLMKYYESDMNRSQERFMSAVYREIRAAIKEIARARGIELVLRARESEPRTRRELSFDNQQRDVLYFDAALDITADVIKWLGSNTPAKPTLEPLPDVVKGERPAAPAADGKAPNKSPSTEGAAAKQGGNDKK